MTMHRIQVYVHITSAQFPPRLQIPGATLVQGSRPINNRQQKINSLNTDFIPRPRRPPPTPNVRDIRPVIEEEEDYAPSSVPSISSFDAEVNKLSIPAITSAVRQAEDDDYQQPIKQPSERPIPISREQIREKVQDFPVPRRQEPRPALRPIRPIVRQELDDSEENIPRQPIRPKVRPQNTQQQFKSNTRPKVFDDEDPNRKRRPPIQILRKFRTDNDDGSITWGFENEDGTFKEETLGTDCVIRGKYGYVDPDGVKREFSYEAGNKCDPNQVDDEDLEEELRPKNLPIKKPVGTGSSRQPQVQPQIQYRPQLAQY